MNIFQPELTFILFYCGEKLFSLRCEEETAKIVYNVIVNDNIKSGWPSGLRRCVQVAVHFCGRGFESHFWQIFLLHIKKVIVIVRHSFYSNQHTDSRVAQWKRAGPITQRSVDRNYALLTFLGSDFNFNIEKTDSSIFQNLPNPVRMAEWSKAPDSRYTALLPW